MNSDIDPVYTRLYHKYSMKYRRIIDKYYSIDNFIDGLCIQEKDGHYVPYYSFFILADLFKHKVILLYRICLEFK